MFSADQMTRNAFRTISSSTAMYFTITSSRMIQQPSFFPSKNRLSLSIHEWTSAGYQVTGSLPESSGKRNAHLPRLGVRDGDEVVVQGRHSAEGSFCFKQLGQYHGAGVSRASDFSCGRWRSRSVCP